MASHQVTIAKASLVASCLRPDPTPISRDEVTRCHTLLDAAISQCSPLNIQKCKTWLCLNILSSAGRTGAFAKYLVALSNSYGKPVVLGPGTSTAVNGSGNKQDSKSASRRKHVHILYLINDLLHHVKHHAGSRSSSMYARPADVYTAFLPHLESLFTAAASFDRNKFPKHYRKIEEILKIWGDQRYYSHSEIGKLRDTCQSVTAAATVPSEFQALSTLSSGQVSHEPRGHLSAGGAMPPIPTGPAIPGLTMINPTSHLPAAATTTWLGNSDEEPASNEPLYILPSTHGDPHTPYYDLPAANLLPCITPNRADRAINPSHIRAVHLNGGPAPPALAAVVRNFLKSAEDLYNAGPGGGVPGCVIDEKSGLVIESPAAQEDIDVDAMGQRIVKDELTGEWTPVEGYYGWSVEFCRRMREKKRQRRDDEDERSRDRGRDQGRDRRRRRSTSSGSRTEDDDRQGRSGWTMGSGAGLGMGGGASQGMGMGMHMGMGVGQRGGMGNGMGLGLAPI